MLCLGSWLDAPVAVGLVCCYLNCSCNAWVTDRNKLCSSSTATACASHRLRLRLPPYGPHQLHKIQATRKETLLGASMCEPHRQSTLSSHTQVHPATHPLLNAPGYTWRESPHRPPNHNLPPACLHSWTGRVRPPCACCLTPDTTHVTTAYTPQLSNTHTLSVSTHAQDACCQTPTPRSHGLSLSPAQLSPSCDSRSKGFCVWAPFVFSFCCAEIALYSFSPLEGSGAA
jgi:hypothetical protein